MPEIVLGGDVMLGRRVGTQIQDRGPSETWNGVGHKMRSAHACAVNLECVIAKTGQPAPGRRFHFQAPPKAIEVLEAAGVDAVSLANNHVLDMGPKALVESLEHLDGAGISRVGAGRSIDEAWEPAWIDADGLEVGVLAFTDNVPKWDVERRTPGVAYAAVDPGGAGFELLSQQVHGLSHSCDLLVLSAHWGPNMRRKPPENFQAFARGLVDAGVDVFWGHSAHLFQGIETHEGGLILYDTGDLVDDYRIDPDEHNDISFLFEVHASQRGIQRVELVPTRIDPKKARVGLADASARSFAFGRMRELCEPFGTPIRREGDRLVVPIQNPRS